MFTLLTPWIVTDFRYLRVAYPDYQVYEVNQPNPARRGSWTVEQQKAKYGNRYITSVEELGHLKEPLLYYGFEESPPVANLRRLVGFMPLPALRAKIDKMLTKVAQGGQFTESWMWGDPHFLFTPVLKLGHYRVDEVTSLPANPTERFKAPKSQH
jgi:hypothetical protein